MISLFALWMPILLSAIIGCIVMTMTGCINLQEAYDAIVASLLTLGDDGLVAAYGDLWTAVTP